MRRRLYPLSIYELYLLGGFVNCDDNVVINGGGSPSVDGAEGYAAATTVIGKLDGSAPESIDQGTQTAPVIQILGSGRWDTHAATATPAAPKSPNPAGAANKHFGNGLGLVGFVSVILIL